MKSSNRNDCQHYWSVSVLRGCYQGLCHWYQQGVGRDLLYLEQQELLQQIRFMPGQHVLQVGATPQLLPHARQHLCFHYFLDEVPNNEARYAIVAAFDDLPLQPNSLNKIVITHALEFCDDPKKMLHECYQALVPGGELIILCFNSHSLWSIRRLFGKKHGQGPWLGCFFSVAALKKQLKQLDYFLKREKTFCFRLPDRFKRLTTWVKFIETLGQLVLSHFGAVNLLVAEKRMAKPLMQKIPRSVRVQKIKGISLVGPSTLSGIDEQETR